MRISNRYPVLKKVLAALEAPLFLNADVEADCWAETTGGETIFHCDPKSANLLLPEADAHTLEHLKELPKSFGLKVKKHFEDEQARAAWFYFVFDVEIQGTEQKDNGMYELQYTAKLRDWSYET
jgi:hypothetical protein